MSSPTRQNLCRKKFNLQSRLLSRNHYPPGSILTSLVAVLLNSHCTTALRSL